MSERGGQQQCAEADAFQAVLMKLVKVLDELVNNLNQAIQQ